MLIHPRNVCLQKQIIIKKKKSEVMRENAK